ncbi:hypothetical protein ABMA27_007461 [Loxostege sticticalis]|uniref:Peptidase S1 domain-containing protein n=1 Tax=Loxostege sticticalis TaxID=481309 RepID=A0ABR3HFJ5_LOXSC
MLVKLAFVAVVVSQYIAIAHENAVESWISNHPAWKKLNLVECGDSAADRIIGGTNAALGQFPWIVRLGYVFSDGDGEMDWMCGGALVTDRHVVTAAHCMPTPDDDYSLTTIRLGEHDTRTNPDCELSVCAPPVQDRKVKNITKHPNFNNPPFHNDIAIIEMDMPANLNDYVAPICLPQKDDQLKGVRIGELVTAAGWGKMNMTTEERAEILQVVALPIVEPNMCDLFGHEFKLLQSEICAGAQYNKDACGGDSGGPLMKVFDTPDGPKNFLVGIVSFGPTVCGIRKPGVYSSVIYFLKWILDNIMYETMSWENTWIISAVILIFGEAHTDEPIPTNNVTPYSNLTIPFSETDDQSYRHITDFESIGTKNNQDKANDAYQFKNITLQNNLDGSGRFKLLPDRSVCGPLNEEERIYGGENTAIDEFPWLARIKYVLDNGKEVYACAGSLITDNYVLTAAHCAVNLTIKEVRLGDWNLETEFDCQGRVCSGNAIDVKIVEVVPYPSYNKNETFKGDIALLRLQRPVNFTDYIRPICLPTSEYVSNHDYSPGSVYWTAGWGKTEFEKKPPIKKKVELNAVPISECRIKQSILSDDTAPFTICAGGMEGKDTCVGDSGGSLVKLVQENNATNWFIMGVTSYGYKECGSEGRPGLYARITPYMNWILQNIGS